MNKVLIIGAGGLVGNMLYKYLSKHSLGEVYGLVRKKNSIQHFTPYEKKHLIVVRNIFDLKILSKILDMIKPNIIVNCIGVNAQSSDTSKLLKVFGWFPQILGSICNQRGIRLIHISTDGVFSGEHGNYIENDFPNAMNDYGIVKMLGEKCVLLNFQHICIRTSFIGPSLKKIAVC